MMKENDIDKLMRETSEHYERKMQRIYGKLKELEEYCEHLENENRFLTNQNRDLIKAKRKSASHKHYKNKRGGY